MNARRAIQLDVDAKGLSHTVAHTSVAKNGTLVAPHKEHQYAIKEVEQKEVVEIPEVKLIEAQLEVIQEVPQQIEETVEPTPEIIEVVQPKRGGLQKKKKD